MPEPIAPTSRLDSALDRHSPRFRPPPTPAASLAIHAAVGIVWLLLFAGAFSFGGVWAWATGLAYIAYDTVLLVFVGWQTRALLRPPPTAVPGARTAETLAVVVAARNEAAVLPQTIRALLAQAEPPDAIVIADDGSTDASARLLVDDFGLAEPAPDDRLAALDARRPRRQGPGP